MSPKPSPIGRRGPRPAGFVKNTYPWERCEQLYVEGRVNDDGTRTYPTLKDVSTLFEVPDNRLRERAAKYSWTDKKAVFQANLEKVRQEKRIQTLSKESVEIDTKALGVSKLGINLVQARIGEIARAVGERAVAKKEYDAAKAQGADELTLSDMDYDPWAPSPIDAREVSTLAAAAAAWHSLAMKSLGEVETTRHEITGAAGAPLEVRASVRAELTSDDPSRVWALLKAYERSSLAAVRPDEQRGVPGAIT